MNKFLNRFLFTSIAGILLLSGCQDDDESFPAPDPVITSMSPSSGPRGTLVTLTGDHFEAAVNEVSVYVNGKLADVQEVTANTIKFEVPPNAGDGPVTISVKGNGAYGPMFDFVYTVTVSLFSGGTLQPGLIDGPSATAQFNNPRGMAIDNFNNLYVADELNHCIRKISTNGSVITFAGNGVAGYADGNGSAARFNHPYDITFDPINSYFYVADRDNHCIRKISMLGEVNTVAGIPASPGYVDAPGLSARFVHPTGVAVKGELENLFIADAGNHCIRKMDNLGIVTTFAGSTTSGNIDGNGTAAKFNTPLDVAWDSSGFFVVTDVFNHNIRKITLSGQVTTIGGAGTPGYLDGPGSQSLFNSPQCAVSTNGEIFICDAMNQRLREIENTSEVITLAGDGIAGSLNGTGMQSRFNLPGGIVRDSYGNLFISETGNHAIRKITIE